MQRIDKRRATGHATGHETVKEALTPHYALPEATMTTNRPSSSGRCLNLPRDNFLGVVQSFEHCATLRGLIMRLEAENSSLELMQRFLFGSGIPTGVFMVAAMCFWWRL